jgi:EmrB/QacA subfamily drug resistance transporter
MTLTDPPNGTGRSPRTRPLVQYALLAGPLLSMLDSSIVNVAAEPVARSLHASLATVQWTISGYLLALGTGLAGTAYLARRYGTVPVYRASLAAFTAASALCALSPAVDALIAARAVQGMVAAPLVPLAMSMLLGGSGKARSVSPVAGILLFTAPAFGPTVGGALIGAASWRFIFAVNVPVGALAVLAARRLPEGVSPVRSGPGKRLPGAPREASFDLPGLIMLGAGLTLVLLGASQGGTDGWGAAVCWAPLTVGAALLAGYARWAPGRASPVLDLSLVRRRVPALSMGLCALAAVVTSAAVFLLPAFAQSAQHRSALAAGIAMAPQGVIAGLSTALGSRALTRFTLRSTVGTGFAFLSVASLGLLLIGATTPLWVVAAILAVRSASIGLVITPLLFALTGPLPAGEMNDASTLFNVVDEIAGSFGVGVLASLYGSLAGSHGPVLALHATGVVIASVAGLGCLLAAALPAVKNIAVTEN